MPVAKLNWHLVRFGSVQSVSFMQWSEHALVAPASGAMQVEHERPVSHAWPHAFEKVLHTPAWQETPAMPPKGTTEPSSVVGAPAAQPQPG